MFPAHLSYQFQLTSLLLFLSSFTAMASIGQPNQILVNIEWLLKHKQDKNIKIVDARSEAEYIKGHISGAVNIPLSATFNPSKNTDRVAGKEHIAKLFSHAGIHNDDVVVLYDGNSYVDAGRVFWVFEVYGHKNVKLLDGGILGWKYYSNEKLVKGVVNVEKTNYVPQVAKNRFITKVGMQVAIKDDMNVIIDVRTKEEFNGDITMASRSGHIPGAVSIPWNENFIEIGGIRMLKPIDELRALYKNTVGDKKVYLYCNRGEHASLSYTILRQLGHDAAHYDGSWLEWGNDESLPIVNK